MGAFEGLEALEDGADSKGTRGGRKVTKGASVCGGVSRIGKGVDRVGSGHNNPSDDDVLSVLGGVAVAVMTRERGRGGSSCSFLLPDRGSIGNTAESVGWLCPLVGIVLGCGWVDERKGAVTGSVGEEDMYLEGLTSKDFVLIRAGPGPGMRPR
jgi:hypothetical protein